MELEPQLQDEPILNYFRPLFVIFVFSKKNKTLMFMCICKFKCASTDIDGIDQDQVLM